MNCTANDMRKPSVTSVIAKEISHLVCLHMRTKVDSYSLACFEHLSAIPSNYSEIKYDSRRWNLLHLLADEHLMKHNFGWYWVEWRGGGGICLIHCLCDNLQMSSDLCMLSVNNNIEDQECIIYSQFSF